MKRTLVLATLMLFTLSLSAQKVKGNRDVTVESTDVQPFTHLIVDEGFDVELIQSNSTHVDIETDSNLHEHIYVRTSGNTLELSMTANITRKKRLKVTVYASEMLDKITVKDNSSLKSSGRINTESLEIIAMDNADIDLSVRSTTLIVTANSSSKVALEASGESVELHASQNAFFKMDLKYDQAQVTMDHRSDAEFSGTVNNGTADVKENSHMRARGLTWDNLQVTARHNSRAEVNVKDDLVINAIDDASITIYNSPKIQIEKFTGEAVIKKQD